MDQEKEWTSKMNGFRLVGLKFQTLNFWARGGGWVDLLILLSAKVQIFGLLDLDFWLDNNKILIDTIRSSPKIEKL